MFTRQSAISSQSTEKTGVSLSLAIALSVLAISWLGGCGGTKQALRAPSMSPMLESMQPESKPLVKNHFRRDNAGSISEEHLRRVLASPVFLEEKARLGVIQVSNRYDADEELPLTEVTGEISKAIEDSGLFEISTEMSADWPADGGISGLRELAARYRSEYLLLYRHRFADRKYVNPWGWSYVTFLGIFVTPSRTLESAGVMEATLFDVKSGTILFTVFERVHGSSKENIWYTKRKHRALKEKLLSKASQKLIDQVVSKSRLLAAARPAPKTPPKDSLATNQPVGAPQEIIN